MFFCFLSACLAAGNALAIEIFTAEVYDETRTAQVAVSADSGGAAYVSLPSLVRQFGGGMRYQGTKFNVDLAGGTAGLSVNSTEVAGSQESFSLKHPIINQGNDILVATDDVEALFSRAFRITVFQQPAALAAPAPEAEEAAIEDTEALLGGAVTTPPVEEGLLTPIAAAAQPAAPAEPVETPPAAATPDSPENAVTGAGAVVLDPGHGGHDSGAVGVQGTVEKDLALALGKETGRILKETGGLTVFLTRSEDKDLSLAERVKLATEARTGLFVSFHVGAAYAPGARGYSVFYAPGKPASGAVAEAVARHLAEAPGAGWPYRAPRAVPMRLLSQLSVPAILIEVGCATNADDARLLATPDGIALVAQAIAQGILEATKKSGGN